MNNFYISPNTSFSGAGQISKYYHLIIDFILPIIGTCDVSKPVNCYIDNARLDPRHRGVLPGSMSPESILNIIDIIFDSFVIHNNTTSEHSDIWLTNQQKLQFNSPEFVKDMKYSMDLNLHPRSRGLWSNYRPAFYKKLRECLWEKITLGSRRFVTCILRKYNKRGPGNDIVINHKNFIEKNLPYEYMLRSVYLEDLSFLDQVDLFYHTDILVAQHGAGMTNCAFMRPGSTIIELPPVTYPCYQILSRQCGHKHYLPEGNIYENILNN